VLDPKAVYGADFPGETFRVLKENERKKYGEYRTERLVLEYYRAWRDGAMSAFDPWLSTGARTPRAGASPRGGVRARRRGMAAHRYGWLMHTCPRRGCGKMGKRVWPRARSTTSGAVPRSEVRMGVISEAESIRNAVKNAALPDTVREVSQRVDVDATGAPAVWIWVVVDDAAAVRPDFPSVAAAIRDAIRDALEQAGIARWPYVRFRTRSEEAELAGETPK
jgi:hypothetical protein